MRHLFLAMAMIGIGLAVTFGTATVLQDVAVASIKSVERDMFSVNEVPKPAMKPRNNVGP